MLKIYIFGRGLGCAYVKKCLKPDVQILGYIDNYATDETTEMGIPIVRQNEIRDDYDYVVVSLMKYKDIRNVLIGMGVKQEKIICFFDFSAAENSVFAGVLDQFIWKAELTWKHNREVVWPAIDNLAYEIHANELSEKGMIPKVADVETSVKHLIKNKCSLVRFGDGEFEMILNRLRLRYQAVDLNLATRLRDIFQSNDEKIMIAIANNYGSMAEFTDDAASDFRRYLTPNVRKEHYKLIDMNRIYYDAYLSRPYLIYRDKRREQIEKKFKLLKKIWEDEDVLIVEGKHTRNGVGNDLYDGVRSLKRILVPDKNAYSCYASIFEKARDYGNNKLIICSIGPTATVLAYDLAKLGYRAIDIGQVDSEYEWFLRDAEERCDVPYKTVSEYVDKTVFAELSAELKAKYDNEVVCVVE